MRRIVRSEAICLRVRDYHESSKLVTFFTLEHGRVGCIAKGARRLRSKFGAALDLFAQSRIIYYASETRTLLTLSDAELVHSFNFSRIPSPDSLSRFLAAEQMAEFALRVIQPHDPSPQLYRLLHNYLSILESCPPPAPPDYSCANLQSAICNLQSSSPYPALVCSFLLKAASFLGFRPELRRCLICRRPIENQRPAYFEPGRGGVVCPRCAGENPRGTRLDPDGLDTLAFLLYTPASEIVRALSPGMWPAAEDDVEGRHGSGHQNQRSAICYLQSPLDLVLGFLGHHFDPLVLNSFHWHAGLERNT